MKLRKTFLLLSLPLLLISKNPVQASELPEYSFDYTGNQKEWTVPLSGKYKIEAWGAQGASNGGKGGYSSGEIELNQGDKLTIQVGGQNGYNGGGNGSASGGGASDVRLNGTDPSKRIMSAAGGGGGSGGTNGGNDTGKGGTSVGAGAGADGVNGGGGGRSYSYTYDTGYWQSTGYWETYSLYPEYESTYIYGTSLSGWNCWATTDESGLRWCWRYKTGTRWVDTGQQFFKTGTSTTQGNSGKGGSNYFSTSIKNTSSQNGQRSGNGLVKITQLVIPPSLDIQLSETEWTKNNITMTIQATSETNPVEAILLPNGTWVNGLEAIYIFTENGDYQIGARDVNGYIRMKNIKIDFIDKSFPSGEFTYEGGTPEQGLEISLNASDIGAGVEKIVLPNKDEVKSNQAKYRVKAPGNYDFVVIDKVGNRKTLTATVRIPSFTIEEDGLHLLVKIDKYYSGEGVIQRTDTGETFTGSHTRYRIEDNGIYTFRVNDGGIWSEQKIYRIENIHELKAPRVSVSFTDNEWYNKPFPVVVKATSNTNTTINHLILPNGVKVVGSTATFVVSQNGLYTFYAVDSNGKIGYHSIYVKNIVTELPKIELTIPSKWTNENQSVDIHIKQN